MSNSKDPSVRAARRLASRLLADHWHSADPLTGWKLARQLRRELVPGHRMWGRKWHVVSRDSTSDDVLFISDEGKLANVHLNWSRKDDPSFPSAGFHDSVEAFADWLAEENSFVANLEVGPQDATEVRDPFSSYRQCNSCGADWSAGEVGADCPECGGYALSRPCPVCGADCGGIWHRAVIDSNDSGQAHWIGKCNQARVEHAAKAFD